MTRINLDMDKTFDEVRDAVRAKIDDYVTRRGQITYATINEIMGVVASAAMESERRDVASDALHDVGTDWYLDVAGPYEDLKCAVNGDVYP